MSIEDQTVGTGLEGLRAAVRGDVVLPGDPDWEAVRRGWNLHVDQQPGGRRPW